MAKTKKKEDILFTVNGFEVRRGSTYKILHKRDADAPSGFIQAGVTKLPSPGVGDTFQCRFDRKSKKFDTGFYTYSPCYANKDRAEVDIIVKNLKKNLVDPMEQLDGEGQLEHTNQEYWDSKRFFVEADMVLNTDDPEDAMLIYFGILTHQLTPKGEEGDTSYSDSSYIIQDTTKVRKLKDERAANKFKAIGVFHTLLEQEPTKLNMILSYLGIDYSDSVEDETLMSMFDEYLQRSEDRIISFNNAIEKSKDKKGMEEISVYSSLKKEVLKSKSKVIKSPNGVLFFEDTEIGQDLRSASENIAKNSDLKDIKMELILED